MLDDLPGKLASTRAQLAAVREAIQAALDGQVGQEQVGDELVPLLSRMERLEAELVRIEAGIAVREGG
jgi:hypothetical protein